MELEASVLGVHIDQLGIAALRLAAVKDRLMIQLARWQPLGQSFTHCIHGYNVEKFVVSSYEGWSRQVWYLFILAQSRITRVHILDCLKVLRRNSTDGFLPTLYRAIVPRIFSLILLWARDYQAVTAAVGMPITHLAYT